MQGPANLQRLVLVAALAAWAVSTPAAPPPFVIAVLPQAPPLAMHESWNPFVERLAVRAGLPLRLKLYDDMSEFERDFLAGVPDLIFAHPAMMVDAHLRQGYVPLVRDRRPLSALLFVRKDAPFERLRDLEGKAIAFVGGHSYCTILMRAMLDGDRERIRFDAQRVGSARNVLRAVLLGKADAGATLDLVLETEPEEMRRLIRPIFATPPTASHPIAAHPRVPAAVRSRLAGEVLDMARDEADRPLLARIRMPDPERADYERDYRPLERRR
jgi:phosphonate transport system substrate-binding protein